MAEADPRSQPRAKPPEWRRWVGIALVTLPRLQVGFHFDGLDGPARASFMRRFDLFMHRGGG